MTAVTVADLDRLNCGFARLDASLTVRDANATFREWCGRADVVGVPFMEVLTPGSALYWQTAVLATVHAQGHADDVALELRVGNAPVAVVGNVTQHGNDVECVMLRFDDRRRYEKALAEAEVAREQQARSIAGLTKLNRMRLDFINAAAHELATPLTPIRIQLAVLSRRIGVDEAAQKAFAMLDRNVDRLQAFVQDLQRAAKVEVGGLKPGTDVIDLAAVTAQAVEPFVEHGFRVAVEAHPMALGDGPGFQAALADVLDNARKFGAGRPVVVTVRADPPRVEVHDEGLGIAGDDLQRVGRPFAQVHDPMSVTEPGPGLGVYVARATLEASGGSLDVASAGRGTGCTVTLTLRRPGARDGTR